jgi:hypothetical protein
MLDAPMQMPMLFTMNSVNDSRLYPPVRGRRMLLLIFVP